MPRLKCPRCATVIDVAPGTSPVCPACGFGSSGASTAAASAPPPSLSPLAPPPVAATPWAGGLSSPPPMPMGGMPMQRTSGKAIAALVLGIVAICIAYLGLITGAIAIVLGILGMKEVDRNPATLKGKGMAIAGLVMGILAVVGNLLLLLFVGALFSEIMECLDDPDAPGCEQYQSTGRPQPSAAAPRPLAAWTEPASPAWPGLRATPS